MVWGRVPFVCAVVLASVLLAQRITAATAKQVHAGALPAALYVPDPHAPSGDSDWDRRAHLAREFCKWGRDVGITGDGILIKPWSGADGGFEVVARRPLEQNNVAFMVPRDVAVRQDSSHTDFTTVFADELADGGGLMVGVSEGFVPLAHMAALVLYERFYVAASFWRPYWDVLPKSFDILPYTGGYTPEEQTLLAASAQTTGQVNTQIRRRQTLVDALLAFVQRNPRVFGPLNSEADQDIVKERAGWVYDVIMTRAYDKRRDGDVDLALVPVSDMLNHYSGASILLWTEKPGWDKQQSTPISAYAQLAATPVPEGGPLLASYGDRCNDFLLSQYGFVETEPGRGDCINTVFSLQPGQPHYEAKLQVMTRHGWVDPDGRRADLIAWHAGANGVLNMIMPLARVLAMGDDYSAERAVLALKGPVSVHNERIATVRMRNLLRQLRVDLLEKATAVWTNVTTARRRRLGQLAMQSGAPIPLVANMEAGAAAPAAGMRVTYNERNLLHVLHGHARVLEWAAGVLTDHLATIPSSTVDADGQ